MGPFREPRRGFSLNSALFASVWLVFLIPGLVMNFAAPGTTLTERIGASACVLAFRVLPTSLLLALWATIHADGG